MRRLISGSSRPGGAIVAPANVVNTTCIRTSLAIAAVVLLPALTAADTINFMGTGKGAAVHIHSPTLGDINVRAGELLWSAGSPSELPGFFYAYCVDPNHWLNRSQVVAPRPSSELSTPWNDDAGGRAAWLVNTYAPTVHDSGTNLDSAALQIAIWSAMYNDSGSLTDGPFRLLSIGQVATTAQTYLDALFAGPNGVNTSSALWLDTVAGQDQMIPTPEPATWLLMGTGLAAAWRAARRKRE
jgi:hypothetical protein